jgi:hypothetical protein
MALFAPRVPTPAPQPLEHWIGQPPNNNYQTVSADMFAMPTMAIVYPAPTIQTPSPDGWRGQWTAPFALPKDFPSPLELFNRPRNVFGG